MKTITETLTNLTPGTIVQINGRQFEIVESVDMSRLPNMSKYVINIYTIRGKRGAAYKLDVARNGRVWYTTLAGARARAIDVESAVVVA